MTLNQLRVGESCTVYQLNNRDAMRKRLQEIGFQKGTDVSCVGISPLGNPKAYLVQNACIAVRNQDAKFIEVTASYPLTHTPFESKTLTD